MFLFEKFTLIFFPNNNRADQASSTFMSIVFGQRHSKGKNWMVLSQNKGVSFYLARLLDLCRFGRRVSKFDWSEYYLHPAYHEASHAVIAYWFGSEVKDEGVWIEPYGGYADLGCQEYNYVPQYDYCIALAGWAAEMRLNPDRAKPPSDQDLTITLVTSHYPDEAETDDEKVLSKLKTAHPNEDEGQIIARYRALEQQTLELVRQEHIWSAIEIIAEELLRRKHLSQSEVEDLLPDGIQWGGRLAAARIAASSSNPSTNP
jgi:hypothetical protein